jgi:hypothetical protein
MRGDYLAVEARARWFGLSSLQHTEPGLPESIAFSAGRSPVNETLLAIDHRVGGFLEMWYGFILGPSTVCRRSKGASVSCGRIAGIGRSMCLGVVLFSCAQGTSTR